jgi:hypothetical protein
LSYLDKPEGAVMKAKVLAVLFASLGAVSSARADLIFNGGVSTYTYDTVTNTDTSHCGASSTGVPSISLACSGSTLYQMAAVTGSGDPYSGSLDVKAAAEAVGPLIQSSMGSGELDLNQSYILTGGFGPATVNLTVSSATYDQYNSGELNCTLTFDGVSQTCDIDGGPMSFSVDYGVPFSIGLDVQMEDVADPGEYTEGSLSYSFNDDPGLNITPEPSSMSLLVTGLAGVLLVAKSRLGVA